MDDFAHELTKRAVARACVALDYKFASASVLDILSDVVRHYVRNIGEHTRDQAEIAGRSIPGIHDALAALEQVRPNPIQWKELRDFVFDDVKNPSIDITNKKWCEPFPFSIPSFPVRQRAKEQITPLDEPVQYDHIPSHLPAFPAQHTYRRSMKKRNIDQVAQSSNDSSVSSRTKRIASIKSISQSLSNVEILKDRAENTKDGNGSVLDESQVTYSSGLLEADHRTALPSSSSDITADVKRNLSKEQKLLIGITDNL